MGGAVLRIGIAAGTTHRRGPPTLQMKRAEHWHVDLDNNVEMNRLYSVFRSLEDPPGTVKCHVHSSPVCTGFTSVQNINKARAKRQTIRGWMRKRSMIRVVRRVHQILRDSKRFQRNKESTRSHELSAKSLTACGNFLWGFGRL